MGTLLKLDGGASDKIPSKVEKWYVEKTGGLLDKRCYTYILGAAEKGGIKALIFYSDYTEYSITMDICAPKALTRDLIKQMFRYPFVQLGVKKLIGYIDQRNILSQKTFERLGCKKETEIKDFFGEGINRLVYTATKEDVAKWM